MFIHTDMCPFAGIDLVTTLAPYTSNIHMSYTTESVVFSVTAIQLDRVNVAGYSARALLDYQDSVSVNPVQTGFYQVDFNVTEKTRTPKMSAAFYRCVCIVSMPPD